MINSGRIDEFVQENGNLLTTYALPDKEVRNLIEATAFGLVSPQTGNRSKLREYGQSFFKWVIINEK